VDPGPFVRPLPDFLAELAPPALPASPTDAPAAERSRPYRSVRRCRWCGRPFAPRLGPGRPALYCPFDRRQVIYSRVNRRVRAGFLT